MRPGLARATPEIPRNISTDENAIAGFAPGRQPDQFRDNSGRLIRKGSNLLLQMHYTTTGRATVDETEVAIYLHDEPPQYIMSGGVGIPEKDNFYTVGPWLNFDPKTERFVNDAEANNLRTYKRRAPYTI